MAYLWGVAIVIIVAGVVYWQLVITEGTYLGQGVVTLLYDRFAHKYDAVKEFDPHDQRAFLAEPLMQVLGAEFTGWLVDVATGTGRLPAAMQAHPAFRGRLVGVDHSRRMLAEARKLLPDVPLVVASAMHLPFASGAVESATCLEALEFFPQPARGVNELARILKSDGVLLTTNRVGWEAKFMPGKTFSRKKLSHLLTELDFDPVKILPWLDIYDQVWARKTSPRN